MDRTTFDAVVAAVDAEMQKHKVARSPTQDHRPPQAGWKIDGMHAWLTHEPDDVGQPLRLGFTDIGVEGTAIAVTPAPGESQPLPMNDSGASTAVALILARF